MTDTHDEPVLGTGIKPKHADKICDSLSEHLEQGESVRGIFSASRMRPSMDAAVVTDRRLVGVFRPDLGRPGKSAFKLEVLGQDMQGAGFVQKLGSWKLSVKSPEGTTSDYATVKIKDGEEFVRLLSELQGAEAPLSLTREAAAGAEAAGLEALRRVVRGSVNRPTLLETLRQCRPSEQPRLIAGELGQGALVIFEDRCLIIKKGIVTSTAAGSLGGGRVTTFMYTSVTGIEFNAGLVNSVLEVLTPSYQGSANKDPWRGVLRSPNSDSNSPYALSNTLPMSRQLFETIRSDVQWVQERVTEAHRGAMQIGPLPTGRPSGNLSEEISRLAALRDSGALTDEEFAQAKAAVLAGPR